MTDTNQKLREALQSAELALWVLHEHNALHHGSAHNTVEIAAKAHEKVVEVLALPTAAPNQDELIRSAERHLSLFDGQEAFLRADMLNAFYQGAKGNKL